MPSSKGLPQIACNYITVQYLLITTSDMNKLNSNNTVIKVSQKVTTTQHKHNYNTDTNM